MKNKTTTTTKKKVDKAKDKVNRLKERAERARIRFEKAKEMAKTAQNVKCVCSLKQVCESKNISVYRLGYEIGIHPNQIYTYSSGNTTPSIEIALLIAKALDSNVNDIWALI